MSFLLGLLGILIIVLIVIHILNKCHMEEKASCYLSFSTISPFYMPDILLHIIFYEMKSMNQKLSEKLFGLKEKHTSFW